MWPINSWSINAYECIVIVVLSKQVQRSSCNSVLFHSKLPFSSAVSNLEVRWECPLVFTAEWTYWPSYSKSQSGENLPTPVSSISLPDWLWVRCRCLISIAKQIAYGFKQGFSPVSCHAASYILLHWLFCCNLLTPLTERRPTAPSHTGCGGTWAGATGCLSAGEPSACEVSLVSPAETWVENTNKLLQVLVLCVVTGSGETGGEGHIELDPQDSWKERTRNCLVCFCLQTVWWAGKCFLMLGCSWL